VASGILLVHGMQRKQSSMYDLSRPDCSYLSICLTSIYAFGAICLNVQDEGMGVCDSRK
jgi:hypothetical protein